MNEKLPETFEEAVDYVAARINKDTVSNPFFHWSGGMNLRNHLGLWHKDTPLYKHMLDRFGLCHADDTGSLIAEAAHAKVNGLDFDANEMVENFKRHWKGCGLNPATMERI